MQTRLFLHHFTAIDFSFLCAERGLLGESFHVSAELSGELDAQGFVMDFGRVKKLLKARIDALIDHRLLVPLELKGLKLERGDRRHELSLSLGNERWRYSAPGEAFAFLHADRVSTQVLERHLASVILPELPENVQSVNFSIEAESGISALPNFRYTHGLRLHEGNCQRLFHGHRNRIDVFADETKDRVLEEELSLLFENVHFASQETIENRSEIELPLERRNPELRGNARLSYQSGQGKFLAEIPASRLMLLREEPSIENIALLAKRILEQRHPGRKIMVRGYEGIDKGAITG